MPLAVFDVTKSYAKIGELFDSSKKYVYKDPGNGMLVPPVREPTTGFYYGDPYYWYEVEYPNGSINLQIIWGGVVVSSVTYSGFVPENVTVPNSPHLWHRGWYAAHVDQTDWSSGEPMVTTTTWYAIARTVSVNVNVIRMPHLWTLYNTSNSLTYSFDGESFTVGPSPPALPPTSPSPRLFFLGVV